MLVRHNGERELILNSENLYFTVFYKVVLSKHKGSIIVLTKTTFFRDVLAVVSGAVDIMEC